LTKICMVGDLWGCGGVCVGAKERAGVFFFLVSLWSSSLSSLMGGKRFARPRDAEQDAHEPGKRDEGAAESTSTAWALRAGAKAALAVGRGGGLTREKQKGTTIPLGSSPSRVFCCVCLFLD
jgi:hypothetical protein